MTTVSISTTDPLPAYVVLDDGAPLQNAVIVFASVFVSISLFTVVLR